MNLSPVNYDEKHKNFIDLFNKRNEKDADYWSKDECKEIKKFIKDHYIKSQKFTCAFCKQKIVQKHNRAWDIEHIISRSSYAEFMFEPKNLCLSCIDCNIKKGRNSVLITNDIKKFPSSSNLYKIIHPHFDKYEEHINILVEGALYQVINNSSKGRETRRIYGLDRFIEDANRNQIINNSPETQKLVATLLCSDEEKEFEKAERELLIKLVNKYVPDTEPELHSKMIKLISKP